MPRTFPPPWTVTEHEGAAFYVADANGQRLGTFFYRDDPGVARTARVLLRDEARRMAANFARLPELLRRAKDET